MELEPKSIVFRDVRLNQAYTSSLCISNPLAAAVEFTLRPSSTRYTISPNRVHLSPNQSIVVSVRLYLNHYPNVTSSRGRDGAIEDSVHLKSTFFDQQIPLSFFMHTSASAAMRSRSLSPAEVVTPGHPPRSGSRRGLDLIEDMKHHMKAKDKRIQELEGLIGQLEAKHPSMSAIIQARIEQEREKFEEKSQKVRFI